MKILKETPTANTIPQRRGDFRTLIDALEYAATGDTGLNFYSRDCRLDSVLTYADLQKDAAIMARKLLGLGLLPGSRFALCAETDPDFVRFFFACHYAGLVPVPLSTAIHMGGKDAFIKKLRRYLAASGATAAMASESLYPLLKEAAFGMDLVYSGTPAAFDLLPVADLPLCAPSPDDLAYVQFTSGSTRFPRGVIITHQAVMANIAGITQHGLHVGPQDRCVSWLPFYHDMGLVGFLLSPMAAQLTVDYLKTQNFIMRPGLWLALMTRNKGTISYSPVFGYALSVQRLKASECPSFDLTSWRVAGVGAEMIRPDILHRFADKFSLCGFKRESFVASYGMAECALAVSFAPLGRGLDTDRIENKIFMERGIALSSRNGTRAKEFVLCGFPLPGHEIEIRDERGRAVPERTCGILHVRGPSIMSGYLDNMDETINVLDPNGWLNTGDLAYMADGQIVVTGRKKDLIIVNGKNIWPQDLELLAEEMPGVRPQDAVAFSVSGALGEKVVLLVQCRILEKQKQASSIRKLASRIYEEFGVQCEVKCVPPHSLPKTSSGKLSRSQARERYLRNLRDKRSLTEGTLSQESCLVT